MRSSRRPPDCGRSYACAQCLTCTTLEIAKTEKYLFIFQYPFRGSPEREEKYAQRTNVERGFSSSKNPYVIGLTKGHFH